MGNKLFYVVIGIIVAGFIVAFLFIRDYQSDPENLSDSGYYPYTDIAASDLQGATVDLLDNENYQLNKTLEETVDVIQEETDGVFVYYWSPVCQFCLNATPNLIDALDSMDTNLVQLNLLEYGAGAQVFMIASTPTLVYYENAQEVERLEGDPGDSETFLAFMEAMVDGESFVPEDAVDEDAATDIEDATDTEEESSEETEDEDQ